MIQQSHGVALESTGAFAARNGFLALVLIAFAYQMGSYRGLPNVLIIMFVLIVLYRFVTNKTTIGRRIYALGGNIKAARLSGIKTERLTFLTFVNMGVLAGLAGMIFAARLNTATPKGGLGFELDVIAACFIGGASAAGGGRQGDGCGDRRLHHRCDEQRHVDPRDRHRLPAGHQRTRAARRRLPPMSTTRTRRRDRRRVGARPYPRRTNLAA